MPATDGQVSSNPPLVPKASDEAFSFLFFFFWGAGGGGLYMREMCAICQIGVLTWKPCSFWVQNGFIFGLFALRFQ